MNITHITDPADIAARYGDARRPENDLPWQSNKLGVTVFVSDQSGCVFLIMRHDPAEPPSRLVRAFFRDAPDATVAVVECSGDAERTALLTPIQRTIASSEDDAPEHAVPPAKTIDLDAPVPPSKRPPRFDAASAWQTHSLQSFYLTDMAQFHKRFPSYRAPNNALFQSPGSLSNHSGDRSTTVFIAYDEQAYYVLVVRLDIEKSKGISFVREVFDSSPDAYAWVARFDDWLIRDTFALGVQHWLAYPGYSDKVSDDVPPDDIRPSDRGSGDSGVPAVTIRPKPTRSGSAANEIPTVEEPEVFFIGPMELAETPTEGELVPARVQEL